MIENNSYTLVYADRIIAAEGCGDDARFVLIRRGLIEDFCTERPDLRNINFIDLSGHIIAPFFCDYHLHFSERTMENAVNDLLRHGIRRVYEGGDRGRSGLQIRNEMKGIIDIEAAGAALYKNGAYGSYLGQAVSNMDDAMQVIDSLVSEKTGYIKVINSGIYDPETDAITPGGFEHIELKRIVSYANSKGLEVFCHANGDDAIRSAVEAGASAIIHGLRVSGKSLLLMARHNTAFIPTVHAFHCLSAKARSAEAKGNVANAMKVHMSAVKTAYEMGIRVLPGSDAGPKFLPYGASFINELRSLMDSGISYPEVIRAAASSLLRRGMSADFLVLDDLTIHCRFLSGQRLPV